MWTTVLDDNSQEGQTQTTTHGIPADCRHYHCRFHLQHSPVGRDHPVMDCRWKLEDSSQRGLYPLAFLLHRLHIPASCRVFQGYTRGLIALSGSQVLHVGEGVHTPIRGEWIQ